MRVFVYRNLRRNCFSVKALSGPEKGLVIAHRTNVWLKDVTFKVGKSGRERVLKTYQKNVHAGVVGTLLTEQPIVAVLDTGEAHYSPYDTDCFINKNTKAPLTSADYVNLIDNQVFFFNT